jgi:tetratricopeptide (TPR) repeat protein
MHKDGKSMKTPQEHIDAYQEFRSKKLKGDAAIGALKPLLAKAREKGLPSWECFLEGRLASEREQYDEALGLHEKALEHDPENSFAWNGKGFTLHGFGRYDEALAAYEESTRLDPSDAGPWNGKGNALLDLGRHADALAAYEESIRLGPKDAIPWNNKGNVLRGLGRHEEALAAYKESSRLDPKYAMPWNNKGNVLGDLGRHDEALAAYEESIRLDPNRPVPWNNKGLTIQDLGRPEQALAAFEEVITRFGDSTDPRVQKQVAKARLWKGVTQVKEGHAEEAAQAFEAAKAADPGTDTAQQAAFVQALVSKAGKVDIISLLRRLLEAFPEERRTQFEFKMDERKERIQAFLGTKSDFADEAGHALLLDLREWNSFTPAVPDQHEIDRGGGYYIRYKGQGLVIDPGYNFIENFHKVGGRLCDVGHIMVTHAHNDHTADFESLLSLLHQYNKEHKASPKCVHLYLSQGAIRKFSGFLPLRGASYLGRIETLNQGNRDNPQVIALHGLDGARLTVLRAFHDDTLSLDYSVGLGFEFDFEGGSRKVVFTGDTGIFPPNKVHGDGKEKEPEVLVGPGADNCLFHEYPEGFRHPHLLIPHLGSVKKEELREDFPAQSADRKEEKALYFYPNHLGLRGLVLLLHLMRPETAIISEWGEELKDIRFDLVRGVSDLVDGLRGEEKRSVFVVPGDVTVACDIATGKFLCHDTQKFCSPDDLLVQELPEPEDSKFYCTDVERTFFFSKSVTTKKKQKNMLKHFYTDVDDYGYPYCLKKQP